MVYLLTRLLVRHARWVILACVLLTLALGTWALGLRVESSLESVLPAGDPAIQYYADVRATFGSDDVGVVGVRADDLFAASTLQKIARVTNELGKLPGVETVLSITNTVDPSEDVLYPPLLLPNLTPAPHEIAALKKKLASTPLYAENLVAPDFKGAAINVFFENLSDAQYHDLGLDEKIRAVLETASGPERFFYTGAAHLKQAAVVLMREDLIRFTPIAIAIALGTMWFAFRTVRGVAFPVAAVLIAIVWTLGVMVLAGKAIHLGTFVLPPLLLVVGSSFGIHVMARYDELDGSGVPREELVARTVENVWLPVAISALTMAVGFGALTMNRITAIRDLGVFSVIGLAFLTISSLTFLPAALQIMGPRAHRSRRAADLSPRLSRFLARLARRSYGSRWKILWVASLVGILAAAGVGYVRVDSDFITYFDPSSEARRANETINRSIVGLNLFYLIIEGGEPGVMKRWEVLKQVKDLQAFVRSQPGVTTSLSIVDYLELIEKGLRQGDEGDILLDEQGRIIEPEARKSFWEDPKSLDPVLSALSAKPETFKSVVSSDFSRANILVRTNFSGSQAIEDMLQRIRVYIAQHFPAGMRVVPTGNLVLLTGTTSDIVAGQVRSLALASLVIFVVLALMFLSVRVGVLAMLPNVLPVIMFFGVLGWLGIYLNLGTSLIATIALGIAVDSTIHYMSRLSNELEGEVDQAAAMTRTLHAVGPPNIYTSLALFLGFMSLTASGFVPIQSFGFLASVTLVASLGANLFVLPALLATTKIITLWDLVAVELGRDPGKTIPMLSGLRPAQARIVVLMGQIIKYGPGEAIVRQGERGDSMYVIIRGQVDVLAGQGEERRVVAKLGRGDVFGEMALVRQNERSADVVAMSGVDVLAVDERFLTRIQRRYPRIASRVFLNLTRILSDRLERMTNMLVGQRAS